MTPRRMTRTTGTDRSPQAARSVEPAAFTSRNLEIYFNSSRAQIDGNLTERLTTFIAATRSTLDVAIYDLTEPAVLEALAVVGRARGKTLRLAYDASGERPTNASVDPKPGKTHQAIEDAGLE